MSVCEREHEYRASPPSAGLFDRYKPRVITVLCTESLNVWRSVQAALGDSMQHMLSTASIFPYSKKQQEFPILPDVSRRLLVLPIDLIAPSVSLLYIADTIASIISYFNFVHMSCQPCFQNK